MSKSCQPRGGVWIIAADSVQHSLQPERGLICEQRKAEGIGYLWGDIALWRGSSVVWTWCVIERRSGVKDERDGRLVLCLWPTACSCGRHCGHAHLHTFGRSSGRQCRPRGVAPFKTEAKGRASRQPFYADTYPYIIWTTVHISRERKRLVSPVSTCKYKQCSAGLSCISAGDKARSSLMS